MASSKKDLDSVMRLSELDVNSVLCASYVSLVQKKTYQNYAFGLSLDVKPENIVNSYYTNQFSGKRKGDARLRGMYHPESDYRRYLPDCFMSCARITSRDYADIYKSIAEYKTLSQVRDDDIYQTRFRIINGFELKNLIKNMGNKLVNHFQNEANLYKSKPNALVAKVKHFEDIPQEYLDFAYENSLPIFILGK